MNSNSAVLLSLPEIAAWQVPNAPAKPGSVIASLPALQRGAVWKVKQIEELWDSILRGFPIGAFIIAPPNDELKSQDFKLQPDEGLAQANYLLLDGQQRATGIALGFYDVWQHEVKEPKSALWLDLGSPPQNRDVEFILRVVTRSHPWGYKRVDPDETITANQMRAALQAFRTANKATEKRPEEFDLKETWPWDAEAPVPLVIIVDALISNRNDFTKARDTAWKRIKKLPMFSQDLNFSVNEGEDDRVKGDADRGIKSQCRNVRLAFEDENSDQYRFLGHVLIKLQEIFSTDNGYRVPALPLDLQRTVQSSSSDEDQVLAESPQIIDAAKKDAIELLFVRVNSAGTPLAGEELTYSLLKAAWPDAAKFIDKLKHKPAIASRIAMFCIRMVLAQKQKPVEPGKTLSMPASPSINEFRRLVRDQNPTHKNFRNNLTDFIENDADALFDATWQFLTSESYALLPALAVDLAQKSPDVYFLLLRWIDRLRNLHISIHQINEETHRRTLGFITALAWFAPDAGKACSAIWADMQGAEKDSLVNYFDNTRFSQTCHMDERFNLRMIPLPTTDEVSLACQRGVTGGKGKQNTISSVESSIWSSWEWNSSFADILHKDKEVKNDWSNRIEPETIGEEDESPSLDESLLQVSRHFMDRLYESRSILLYAQREWLRKWYPNFDPSLPEHMEDKNRPWDYDHILPQNLLRAESGNARRNIPQVIWDWCGSIGNLRAWPMEANRSDSDTHPMQKLTKVSTEEKRYAMKTSKDELAASFVQEDIDWLKWQLSVPLTEEGSVEDRRYLASINYHEQRKALITAIVLRFIALYGEWYSELRIDDLQP